MAGKSNRREFLRGQSALQAFGDLILSALPSAGPEGPRRGVDRSGRPAAGPDHYLLHVGRRAMACEFQIFFNAGQYRQATEVALQVLDFVEKLEDELTFFRDSSRLSQINQNAARRAVEVDPGLFEILDLALRTACGDRWGLRHHRHSALGSLGIRPTGGRGARRRFAQRRQAHVGSQWVELDRRAPYRPLSQAGYSVEPGQPGKGYALDRCAEHFHARRHRTLLNPRRQQQPSRAAPRRSRRRTANTRRRVGLWDCLIPCGLIGDWARFGCPTALWEPPAAGPILWHQGRRYGHILDPRTGWPAQNMLTATMSTARCWPMPFPPHFT